jgi:hypothetical protein
MPNRAVLIFAVVLLALLLLALSGFWFDRWQIDE